MQRLSRTGVFQRMHGCVLFAALSLLCIASTASAIQTQAVPIALGQSVVILNGPWKFHTGDNVRWAEPDFDDSAWETVDLTAPSGVHDPDATMAGYVSGWGANGHQGYSGFAWYRLRVSLRGPQPAAISLLGPGDVDDAYQVFFNDRMLGQEGEFAPVPAVYAIVPRLIALPPSLWWENGSDHTGVIAFRVWMSADTAKQDPSAGGLRIAPKIGSTDAVSADYRLQWMQTFVGNVVDAALAIAFCLLAAMALRLRTRDRVDPFYPWLAVALILLALTRADRAIFFWTQLQSESQYVLLRHVLLEPLILGAWLMTWRAAFGLRTGRWVPFVVGALTIAYMASDLLRRSMFSSMFGHPAIAALAHGAFYARSAMLLVLAYIVVRGARGREGLFTFPALLLVSIGLFGRELSELRVPGIWFPFGVGVSRAQYAYAAFDIALLGLLLYRRSRLAPATDRDA